MNTRKTLSLAAISLGLGCVGAPDAADLEEVAQTQHALTYSVAPASPLLNGVQLQVARASITGFTPSSAAAGTRISLRGTAFERNRYGRLTLNGLGYSISFAGVNGARVAAVNPVRVSSTEIAVTVPTGAATGRVRLSDALGSFSESPTDFVVPLPPPPPAPTRVRVTNNNQYDIVALVVNGTLVRSCANALAPGASVDVNVMPGGFAVGAVLGLCTQGAPVSIPPSHLEFNSSVGSGLTFTVNANPFTLGDLLTNWGANSGEWASGLYLGGDGEFHQNSLIFDRSARWSGFDRGTFWGSGQATVTSWPNRANCVSFRLGANATVSQTCLPFSTLVWDGLSHVRR